MGFPSAGQPKVNDKLRNLCTVIAARPSKRVVRPNRSPP